MKINTVVEALQNMIDSSEDLLTDEVYVEALKFALQCVKEKQMDKTFYVVLVTSKDGTAKVSQEAYLTFEDAENFIKGRSFNPVQITSCGWKDDNFTCYTICDVSLGGK